MDPGGNGENPNNIGSTPRGRAVLKLKIMQNLGHRSTDIGRFLAIQKEIAARRSELRNILITEENGYSSQFTAEPSQDQAGLIAESMKVSVGIDNRDLWVGIDTFRRIRPEADTAIRLAYDRLDDNWGLLFPFKIPPKD